MLLGGLWHGANWTFVLWGGLHGAYLAIHKMLLERRAMKREIGMAPPVSAFVPTLAIDGPAAMLGFGSAPAGAQMTAVAGAFPTARFESRRGEPYSSGVTAKVSGSALEWLRSNLMTALKILVTFHLVCLAWIFFRADTLPIAINYLMGIVTLRPVGELESMNWLGLRTTILFAVLLAVEVVQFLAGRQTVFTEWHWAARAMVYACLIIVILVCGGLDADVPFIYFQF
jgi:D-alanyl-lipoteichoic acid acyltransferase DltB (MBOAT superfamily)